MKRCLIFLTFLICLTGAGAQQMIGGKNVDKLWGNETTKVFRREFENGRWERYRRGPYNNLQLQAVEVNGSVKYILSRYYTENGRHVEMETPIMPIFSIHLHWWYSGCVLEPEDVASLRNIAPGETILIEKNQALFEFEAHSYDDFFRAILAARPSPEVQYLVTISRDAKGKKIILTDTGDILRDREGYWEMKYQDYMMLFEEPRK